MRRLGYGRRTLARLSLVALVLAAAMIAVDVPHAWAANLVTNGDFESNGGNGQLGFNTFATGWSVPAPPGSYTFLFAPGTADTPGGNGAPGQYGGLSMWGPNNGSANGLPATSPTGGYFIAQDSAFQQGAIFQTVNGLTPGQNYNVGFWWAGAQQEFFNGPTFDRWDVTFGNQTQDTAFVNLPDHGFSGWQFQNFTFTATSPSQVLSFFADGGPGGVPPFALLDGVSVNSANVVPEPATLSLVAVGLAVFGAARLRRRAKAAMA
jgi:hypothetical protein